MTSNTLTEKEERDVPSQIVMTLFWIASLGYFLDRNMCGF